MFRGTNGLCTRHHNPIYKDIVVQFPDSSTLILMCPTCHSPGPTYQGVMYPSIQPVQSGPQNTT